MFRTLIYPSSGACDCSVELPHWSYCSCFDVCWSFGVVGLEWYPCCRLQPATRIPSEPVERKLFEKLIVFCFLYKKKVSCFLQKRSLRNSFLSNIKLHCTHLSFIQVRFSLIKDLKHSQSITKMQRFTISFISVRRCTRFRRGFRPSS